VVIKIDPLFIISSFNSTCLTLKQLPFHFYNQLIYKYIGVFIRITWPDLCRFVLQFPKLVPVADTYLIDPETGPLIVSISLKISTLTIENPASMEPYSDGKAGYPEGNAEIICNSHR
jgi:hypothetical protein